MKATFLILVMAVIGVICFTPRMPSAWPPKKLQEQKESIPFKEAKIDNIITKLEYNLKVDSLEINSLKTE